LLFLPAVKVSSKTPVMKPLLIFFVFISLAFLFFQTPATNSNIFLLLGFAGIILLYLHNKKTIKLKDEK
jgi:positive regulator of sigma E activity